MEIKTVSIQPIVSSFVSVTDSQHHPVMLEWFSILTLLHKQFQQFDWLKAVVFQLNLKYLHVKVTYLLEVVV